MQHHPWHKFIAAIIFLISLTVYGMTMAPTVSFWDCGEFIACSFRLAVPHPPGAPLYLLVGRVFTLIPHFLIEDVARRVNLISVLSSAFTVLFLYLIIVHLVRAYLKSTDGFLAFVPYLGGAIGALIFAFTPSFWFNAVEAEVYAPSMLFTGLVVWLVFHWSERSEQVGNEKYILLIAYLIGLALGVHLLNVLALPTVFMIIYYRRFPFTLVSFALLAVSGVLLTLMVYPGMVKGIPTMIDILGFGGMVVLMAIAILMLWLTLKQRQHALALLLSCVLLIAVGYSSYMTIYIRSGLDPSIDENNPETIGEFIKYMNREQYGTRGALYFLDRAAAWQESPNRNDYRSAGDFFWRYQVNRMYVRYFLWNFAGNPDDGAGVDFGKFWLIPLLLGLIGSFYHFYRDWKHGLAVLVLFLMTGLAIIIYLNQPDPQPRERDYSYVGSFFAFAIWVGIGAAALLEKITLALRRNGNPAGSIVGWVAALLLLIGPARMLAVNYHTQDRSGNFVAWDYSYNLLRSCESGSVLFTNGDNDTFPLWYLQEVEGIGKDMRVANLSLLNTSWYIEQLKNREPKVPISLTDEQIQNINLARWPRRQAFEIPIQMEQYWRAETDRYRRTLALDSVAPPQKMSFEIEPKLYVPGPNRQRIGVLRVQDLMILNILSTNQFRQPVYFSITTGTDNQLDGLQEYLRMDGLLLQVTPIKGWDIAPDRMYDLVMNQFRYRNLDNPDVYYDESTIRLLQNYRSAFYRLAHHFLIEGDTERFQALMKKLYSVMPPEVIPFAFVRLERLLNGMAVMAGIYPPEKVLEGGYALEDLRLFGDMAVQYGYYDLGIPALQQMLQTLERNPTGPEVTALIYSLFRSRDIYDRASAQEKAQLIARLVEQMQAKLVDAWEISGQPQRARELLEKRLQDNPGDPYATARLKSLQGEAARP